jgi:hypothetical protein
VAPWQGAPSPAGCDPAAAEALDRLREELRKHEEEVSKRWVAGEVEAGVIRKVGGETLKTSNIKAGFKTRLLIQF